MNQESVCEVALLLYEGPVTMRSHASIRQSEPGDNDTRGNPPLFLSKLR